MKTYECRRFLSTACAFLAMASWADAGQSCEQFAALESYTSAEIAPRGATCGTFLSQSAKTGVSCYWAFPYRDGSAERMADSLWALLQNCRPGTQLAPDWPVNHPDSFQLREWSAEGAIYRVSLKDKAGQQRTLVFLAFEKS
ncbi:hypothetical protein [Nitratireductor sp. XY-223]|uniref:hypothetical protein n=1 Tax=Nitratireductor sp. XY-223 TaxID=2561926 RepID=UPI0010AB29A6|nr:hypothetical protein [Nitratireductor sp. XY-223]